MTSVMASSRPSFRVEMTGLLTKLTLCASGTSRSCWSNATVAGCPGLPTWAGVGGRCRRGELLICGVSEPIPDPIAI